MRHEVMMDMSLDELDAYGRACGIDVSGLRTKAQKVGRIEERRGRVAEVHMLGTTMTIPIRRLHDKRVSDLLRKEGGLTDEEAATAMVLLLGEEQYEEVIDRCTDEDDVVDVEALGCAFVALFSDPELKNY